MEPHGAPPASVKYGSQVLLYLAVFLRIGKSIAVHNQDDYDAEWQGIYFPVTDVDLAIVEKTIQILKSQDQRNVNADRNCDDDSTDRSIQFILCALRLID